MNGPELIIALHNAGIRVAPDSDRLHVDAPKGVMTTEIAAALRAHKPLLLAVFRTLPDRGRDADWETVRGWLLDDTAKTFTKPMLAAAQRLSLAVGGEEWPEAFARRFRTALRVHGLLAAMGDPPVRIGRPAPTPLRASHAGDSGTYPLRNTSTDMLRSPEGVSEEAIEREALR